jgi:hypothetical protein
MGMSFSLGSRLGGNRSPDRASAKSWGTRRFGGVEQEMINAILIGFGVVAFAIGVVLYVVQFRQGLQADASKKWPTSSGTITASALERSPESKRRYRAVVQYRYRVGAAEYQSDRVFWGGNEGRQRHMALVVEAYPVGRKVPIHYDPQNPTEAILDPAQNAGSRPLVLYGVAMMALGLFAFTGGVYALFH